MDEDHGSTPTQNARRLSGMSPLHSSRMPRRQSPFTVRLLESHVIRKAVKRGLEGGDWKSAYQGNSLVAYPTARPDLNGRGGA